MGEHDERSCSVKRKAMLIQDPLLPIRIDLAEVDRMLEELDNAVNEVGLGLVGAFSAFAIHSQELAVVDCLSETYESFPHSPLQQDNALMLGHGLSIYADSAMAELMHNYVHVVADILQPARHADNPYHSLYIPKAIEAAASDLFVGTGGTPSSAGTALFHALLAVSAFHLHRHQPARSRYCRQGRTHRIEAIENLQRSLAKPDEGDDHYTVMSAMLSLVSIGVGSTPPNATNPTHKRRH